MKIFLLIELFFISLLASAGNGNKILHYDFLANDTIGFGFGRQVMKNIPCQLRTDLRSPKNWRFENPSKLATFKKASPIALKLKNKVFSVNSNGTLVFSLGKFFYNTYVDNFALNIEVSGSDSMEVICKMGNNLIKRKYNINTGDKYTSITFPINISDHLNIASFQLFLSLTGKLKLKTVKLWRIPEKDVSIVEGSLTEVTTPPLPEKIDYPDCLAAAQFKGEQILIGANTQKNIILYYKVIKKHRNTKFTKWEKNKKIIVKIIPFDLASKKFQRTQVVDELDNFELNRYAVIAGSDFTREIMPKTQSNILFKDSVFTHISRFSNPVNPPLPETLIKENDKVLEKLQGKIEKLKGSIKPEILNTLNDAAQKAWDKRKQDLNLVDNGICIVEQTKGVYALPYKYSLIRRDRFDDYRVAPIVQFDKFLKAHNVHLIVQLVPNFYDVAMRVINPEYAQVPDYRSLEVADKLLQNGIETHYTTDIITNNPFHARMMFNYPVDSHPWSGTHDLLTSLMADRLKNYANTSQSIESKYFSDKYLPAKWGNLTRLILYKNKGFPPPEYLNTSSILILGNSFTRVSQTNSYIMHLAMKMNYFADLMISGGDGPKTVLPLKLFENTSLLKGKQVVLLLIGTDHLFRGGPFVNLKEIDNHLLMKSGKKMINQYVLKIANKDIVPLNQVKKYNFYLNLYKNKALYELDVNEKINSQIITLSSELRSKPLLIELLLFSEIDLTLSINGVVKTYKASSYNRRIFFELSQDNLVAYKGKIKLLISSSDNRKGIVAFGKLLLYN